MGHSIFITGTDTGVGKTYFTSGLIRVLRDIGVDVVGFKPLESGGRHDAQKISSACDDLYELDEINPIWFEQPLAPLAAADAPEGINIDLIKQAHQKLIAKHDLVLVEGAGGWLVPITANYCMSDLATELCDEVIIVAANRLGVINHTLLTFRSIEEKKIDCARMILNHLPATALSIEAGDLPYPADPILLEASNDLSLSSNADLIRQCLPGLEVLSLMDESSFPELAKALIG